MGIQARQVIAALLWTAAAAATMAAAVPARLLGQGSRGTLGPGAAADFAIYDADVACLATFVAGRKVYSAEGA